jgi:hypothetical protein
MVGATGTTDPSIVVYRVVTKVYMASTTPPLVGVTSLEEEDAVDGVVGPRYRYMR